MNTLEFNLSLKRNFTCIFLNLLLFKHQWHLVPSERSYPNSRSGNRTRPQPQRTEPGLAETQAKMMLWEAAEHCIVLCKQTKTPFSNNNTADSETLKNSVNILIIGFIWGWGWTKWQTKRGLILPSTKLNFCQSLFLQPSLFSDFTPAHQNTVLSRLSCISLI